MEGGGGGGGERSCRDNYNDREHKADEARGGEEGDKERSENSRGILQTRSKEVCVCARFFFFFSFFFSTYPFTYPGKGRALFLRLFISNWWRIGFDEGNRTVVHALKGKGIN